MYDFRNDEVRLDYDSHRGGFFLGFPRRQRREPVERHDIEGWFEVVTADGQMIGIESFWGHGGIAFDNTLGWHGDARISLTDGCAQVGPLRLTVERGRLTLASGSLSPDDARAFEVSQFGITYWLTHIAGKAGWPIPGRKEGESGGRGPVPRLAGLSVPLAQLEVPAAIEWFTVSNGDIKG